MRKRLLALSTVIFLFTSGMLAQDFKGGLTFKRLFMDYQTLNDGDFFAFRKYTPGLEASYLLPIAKNLDLNIPVKIGVINDRREELPNIRVMGADLQLNYHILDRQKTISPYLAAGAGFVVENLDSTNFQFPVGAGMDIRIFRNAYFNWQSEFRPSTKTDKSNFHHSVGIKYLFRPEPVQIPEEPGILDTDRDGIADANDKCPRQPGIPAFDGCPDTDNDGIPDYEDACPEVPGLIEFDGCPDTDRDGVPDNEDECPNEPGPASNNGCPDRDRDGDGVPDDLDDCPDIAGLAEFNGCPDSDGDGIPDPSDRCPETPGLAAFDGCADTDGDGIPDPDDICPNTPGPASNNGCPVIEQEDRDILDFAMQAVEFEHNSASLRMRSFDILDQVVDVLRRYPDYKVEIRGHTDSTGSESYNQRLSEERAKACYDYLVSRGIKISRLGYIGYGETRPIGDNNTYAGRQLNRRVEFNLYLGE